MKEQNANKILKMSASILWVILISSTAIQMASALEINKDLKESQEGIPKEMWNRTYSYPCSSDTCIMPVNYVQQTMDGEYVLIGDSWIMKTDSLGNKLWGKTFGDFSVNSGQQTADGGYILAGSKCLSVGQCWQTGEGDSWIIKADHSGNKQWEKTFKGRNNDAINSVQQTKDGGYILAGYTGYLSWTEYLSEGSYSDALLIKTDSNGNRQWNKIFGGDINDEIRSVKQTVDGGYILVGITSYEYGPGGENSWLIKTDNLGNKQWEKTFEGTIGKSVQQTKDGGYILTGNSHLVKTDNLGNKQWEKFFAGHDSDSVQQTSDEGYIFSGYTRGSNSWILKTDILGNKQWDKIFEGGYKKYAQQTKDGGYILTGLTFYYNGQHNVFRNRLIRLTSDTIVSTPVNLLKNPGFETVSGILPQYWTKFQTGTKAIFTYPTTGRIGNKAVSIRYAIKETDKVALWQQTGVVIAPSKQYKLSGYMKLEGVTGGGILPRLNGASLRINWYTSTGEFIKTDLITKSGTGAWTKYEKTFTAPSNAGKATIGGDLFNAAGKVTFDDLSFVKTS